MLVDSFLYEAASDNVTIAQIVMKNLEADGIDETQWQTGVNKVFVCICTNEPNLPTFCPPI